MSSSLLGTPSDPWPLSRAVDALGDSARRAGRPGLIWLAGIFYPSLTLNLDLVRSLLGVIERATDIAMPGSLGAERLVLLFGPQQVSFLSTATMSNLIGMTLLTLPLFVLLYRLIVGLAKVSDPRGWRPADPESPGSAGSAGSPGPPESGGTSQAAAASPEQHDERAPGLAQVWSAGAGLGLTAFGMWIMLLLLLIGALLVLIGPLVTLVHVLDLRNLSPLVVGLILPVLAVVMAYGLVLQVVNQLALHSLAHNDRGLASALTHAWRLVRGAPGSAMRATLVDLILFAFVLTVRLVISRTIGLEFTGNVLLLCVYGFAGVARACYWARTYRALGGLSAADRVPGLSPA